VSDGQPDVFIKVKHLDTLPVDVLRAGQRVEKIQLGSSGRDDDASALTIEDRPPEGSGGLLGGGLAESELVFKDSYEHAAISFERVCA
jgi:cold shock CspA family protein